MRGHTGVEGNEKTDSLAKSAAQSSDKSLPFVAFSKSHLKRQLKMNSMELWQHRGNVSENGPYTYEFLSQVST